MKVNLIKDNKLELIDIGLDNKQSADLEPINLKNLSVLVRVNRQNRKQGTKKAKTRSEVKGHSAKPYRQKGTGWARQGSTKAPHFRGGGVAHGPTPDYKKLKLNSKFKRGLLVNLLRNYLANGEIYFIDLQSSDTKGIRSLLIGYKSLLVYDDESKDLVNKVRNLRDLYLLPYSVLASELILNYQRVVFDLKLKDELINLIK